MIRRSEPEKRAAAYHEAGHATVCQALPSTGQLMKVTILNQGVCWILPAEPSQEDRLCMQLGGAVAEEIKLGASVERFQRSRQLAQEQGNHPDVVNKQWERARQILERNDPAFTRLAEALMRQEELIQPELESILSGVV